jgi:hypothetical protein
VTFSDVIPTNRALFLTIVRPKALRRKRKFNIPKNLPTITSTISSHNSEQTNVHTLHCMTCAKALSLQNHNFYWIEKSTKIWLYRNSNSTCNQAKKLTTT